jgi:hypothetical protein
MVIMVTMEHYPNPQFSKAHLKTLILDNFKMFEAMGLKLLQRGPLEWHYLRTNFMKFHEAVQKLLVGDTQTGDLIRLLSFLSRLQMVAQF